MQEARKRFNRVAKWALLALVVVVSTYAGVTVLGGHREVASDAVPKKSPPATALLKDIKAYRESASTLDPQVATQRWFALYDRAAALHGDDNGPNTREFDPDANSMVSERSLLAALPPPAAWATLRAEAARRAELEPGATRMLALRYLAELLTGDRTAAGASLTALESKDNRDDVLAARALIARLYGDIEARVESFRIELALPASDFDELRIPDLVTMVGAARARALLTQAMVSKRQLSIESGEQTRALARAVALENVAHMKVAQWRLAASVDASALYEAMSLRFDPKDSETYGYDWARQNAAIYYFLHAVKSGRHVPAEAVLDDLAGTGPVSIPREAVEALQRAQLNEPLFRFLDALLARRPDLDAWDLYIEQAAYTGHAPQALALIDRLLEQKSLSAQQRGALQARQLAALLAADRIDDARTGIRVMLAKPPSATDPNLNDRIKVAGNATRIGRLLGDAELTHLGTGFLRAAVALPEGVGNPVEQDTHLVLFGELRRQGHGEEALKTASVIMQRKPATFAEAMSRRMGHPGTELLGALVETAGIHSAAGRHSEVLALLAESPHWGTADLAPILNREDSQRQPLGVIVARALQETGDNAGALRIARATIAALPGRDGAYEVIAALDPAAITTFDTMFAGDEFEERPLIWKATVLLAAGASADAEATIRRAIAVDPSDGEEGPNDRMRAYAVLAQILRDKGETKDAQIYANAVEAIRISEHGDEFYAAGMYERAFNRYRAALEKFSDAYCIQSRLAVQLSKQGRRKEALEHYRRAYELMPASFGRVESHCFGCESVFQGAESQTLAERVFTDIIRKTPGNAQAHYLLAYLREQQGRYEDAVRPLRAAASLDTHYLNAWKHLHDVARKTYIESGEIDIARLKLLELDPLQRHAHYELNEVGELAQLWTGVARARNLMDKLEISASNLYALRASASWLEESRKDTPPEVRAMTDRIDWCPEIKTPAATLYEHVLIVNARELMRLGNMDSLD